MRTETFYMIMSVLWLLLSFIHFFNGNSQDGMLGVIICVIYSVPSVILSRIESLKKQNNHGSSKY